MDEENNECPDCQLQLLQQQQLDTLTSTNDGTSAEMSHNHHTNTNSKINEETINKPITTTTASQHHRQNEYNTTVTVNNMNINESHRHHQSSPSVDNSNSSIAASLDQHQFKDHTNPNSSDIISTTRERELNNFPTSLSTIVNINNLPTSIMNGSTNANNTSSSSYEKLMNISPSTSTSSVYNSHNSNVPHTISTSNEMSNSNSMSYKPLNNEGPSSSSSSSTQQLPLDCELSGYCATCAVLDLPTNDKYYRNSLPRHPSVYSTIFYGQGPPIYSSIPECNPWANTDFGSTAYQQYQHQQSDYYIINNSSTLNNSTTTGGGGNQNSSANNGNTIHLNDILLNNHQVQLSTPSISIPSTSPNIITSTSIQNCQPQDSQMLQNYMNEKQLDKGKMNSNLTSNNTVQVVHTNTEEINDKNEENIISISSSCSDADCSSDSDISQREDVIIEEVEDDDEDQNQNEIKEQGKKCEKFPEKMQNSFCSTSTAEHNLKCMVCLCQIAPELCSSLHFDILENIHEDITDIISVSSDIEIVEDEMRDFTQRKSLINSQMSISRLSALLGLSTKIFKKDCPNNSALIENEESEMASLCVKCAKLASIIDSLERQLNSTTLILKNLLHGSYEAAINQNVEDSKILNIGKELLTSTASNFSKQLEIETEFDISSTNNKRKKNHDDQEMTSPPLVCHHNHNDICSIDLISPRVFENPIVLKQLISKDTQTEFQIENKKIMQNEGNFMIKMDKCVFVTEELILKEMNFLERNVNDSSITDENSPILAVSENIMTTSKPSDDRHNEVKEKVIQDSTNDKLIQIEDLSLKESESSKSCLKLQKFKENPLVERSNTFEIMDNNEHDIMEEESDNDIIEDLNKTNEKSDLVHKKSKILCDLCGKILSTVRSFLNHSIRHNGNFSLECTLCKKGFVTQAALEIHHRTHSGEKPFFCSSCFKSFTTKSNMLSHQDICKVRTRIENETLKSSRNAEIKNQNNQNVDNSTKKMELNLNHQKIVAITVEEIASKKEYEKVDRNTALANNNASLTCEKCGLRFRRKERYEKHIKGCRSQVSKCSECFKIFPKKSELRVHLRTHTKSKPFECECGVAFATKGNLIAHSRTHSDQKRYQCSQCDKGFNRKFALNLHINRHNGIKNYTCVCTRSFHDPSNLLNHKKRCKKVEVNMP